MANISLCGQIAQNLGAPSCDVSKGVGKKLLIFNGAIAANDYATPLLFNNKLIANSKLSRENTNKIFPIPEMQDIVDASEANTEGTLGLGFKAIIREGRPAYTIKMFAGAQLLKLLRKWNNQTIRILEIDANNRVWGTMIGTNFVGYEARLFFDGNKMATGQNLEEGVVTLTLSILNVAEYKDNSTYQDISDITSIVGLLDVELYEISRVDHVIKYGARVKTSQAGGSVDLYDQLDDLIADPALWVSGTGAKYATALGIDTVVKDDAVKGWTVTHTEATFDALAANTPIQVRWVAPEVLDAEDVTNVESIPLVIEK